MGAKWACLELGFELIRDVQAMSVSCSYDVFELLEAFGLQLLHEFFGSYRVVFGHFESFKSLPSSNRQRVKRLIETLAKVISLS